MKDNLIKAWPQRPWILASFLTVAGFIFYLTIESKLLDNTQLHIALTTFVVSVSILFAFALERLRWTQVLIFSLAVGCILSFVDLLLVLHCHCFKQSISMGESHCLTKTYTQTHGMMLFAGVQVGYLLV